MISQTAEYALRAMAWLAQSPSDRTPSGAIAARTQVPQDYLAKVLQQLSDAGLIAGRRGVNGGYRLTRDPDQIRLIEVINAVGRVERIQTCPLGLTSHGDKLCALHQTMDNAIAALLDILESRTLADLGDHPEGLKPLCEAQSGNGAVAGGGAPARAATSPNGAPAR